MELEIPRIPWWFYAGLTISTALGLSAWFLHGPLASVAAITAITLWCTLLWTLLLPTPLELLDLLIGFFPDRNRRRSSGVSHAAQETEWEAESRHRPGDGGGPELQVIRELVTRNEIRAEERHQEHLREVQRLEINSKNQAQEIKNLRRTIENLHETLDAEQAWGKRLAMITFFGGIAISIPIGFFINLSTK